MARQQEIAPALDAEQSQRVATSERLEQLTSELESVLGDSVVTPARAA
jgi:hypothetical protein